MAWAGARGERREGRWNLAHCVLCSACPITGRGRATPAAWQGTEAGTEQSGTVLNGAVTPSLEVTTRGDDAGGKK